MTGKTNNNKQNKAAPRQLPATYKLSPFDVICARGKLAQEHEGNLRMKALVQTCLPQYSQTNCKVTKSKIVSSVVESVRQMSPEGGFVKFVDDGWVCVNDRFAREKVGQQFRDLLHTKYRSSTKAKARARNQQTGGVPENINPPMPPLTASTPLPVKGAATAMLASFNKNNAEQALMSSSFSAHNQNSLAAQLSRGMQHQPPMPRNTTTDSASVKPMPAPASNFLSQLIQSLDRSSEGAHADFENYMTMKNPATAIPLHTTSVCVQGHAEWPKLASAESQAILSDLDPTHLDLAPMKDMRDELRNTSAIFSIDAFLWEPRC